MTTRDDAQAALDEIRTEAEGIDDPHRSSALAHLEAARAQIDAATGWIDRHREQREAAERARARAEVEEREAARAEELAAIERAAAGEAP